MARKISRGSTTLGQGSSLVVLSGLPRDTLQWVTTFLARDTSRKSAKYVGAPSPQKEWRGLYKKNNIVETLKLIERESLRLKPHRIIVLYVLSDDVENLLRTLDIVCFLSQLKPDGDDLSTGDCGIGWRHNRSMVRRHRRPNSKGCVEARLAS